MPSRCHLHFGQGKEKNWSAAQQSDSEGTPASNSSSQGSDNSLVALYERFRPAHDTKVVVVEVKPTLASG